MGNLLFWEFAYPLSLNQASFLNTTSIMHRMKVPLHQLSLTSWCVYTDCEQELSYVDVNVVVFLQFVLMQTRPFAVQVEATIFLETSPI